MIKLKQWAEFLLCPFSNEKESKNVVFEFAMTNFAVIPNAT
jgi:hypothetical protein